MNNLKSLTFRFNFQSMKGKAIALTLEHAPCCLLSIGASYIGVNTLNHNPALELGFAVGGAIIGEKIGHKLFCHGHDSSWRDTAKRYGISLAFGLSTWGIHQQYFHHDVDKDHAGHVERHDHSSATQPHHH